MLTRARALPFSLILLARPVGAQAIELGLPIDCEIGKTCWVQQYVDHDPSSAVQDYACGAQTYDGHDGTDFRIRDVGVRGVKVLAAAPGTVKSVRDGMPDLLSRTEEDKSLIRKRECGNGMVIDHAGGWQTQYCHLRVGSVAVRPGDKVERGAILGEVGYSGAAQFPHVHLSVRKDDLPVDPFRADSASCGAPSGALWSATTLKTLAYREGDVIASGFAPGPVKKAALEEGKLLERAPSAEWPALVAYAWAINLQGGDEVKLALAGPKGELAVNTVTLDRGKAQYMLFAGKKRPKQGWLSGGYTARLTILRDGETVIDRTLPTQLP